MSKRKKILAQAILLVLVVPAVMIFNNDPEVMHYNIIGMAYAVLMAKIHRHILPGWVVDYIHS